MRTVDLGPCTCPNTPHDHDEAVVRDPDDLTYGQLRHVSAAFGEDNFETQARLFTVAIVSWTKVNDSGEPLPVSQAAVDALPIAPALRLRQELDNDDRFLKLILAARGITMPEPPPNSFGGPSADGSAAPSPSKNSRRRSKTRS